MSQGQPTPPNATPGAPQAGGDPSMEDILASIRRILSDDEQAAGATPGHVLPPAPQPAPDPAAGEDHGVLALSETMLVTPEPTPAPVAQPAPPLIAIPTEPSAPRGELVAPEAAALAAGSVGALVRTLLQEREAVQVHRGGPTIEDLVREELRPLLKSWLDANLPGLVERLVRAEIERVVGRVVP